MATTQFLQGVSSVYINDIMMQTNEDVQVSVSNVLYDFAESNNGPLANVLKWNKEAGTVRMTILHYTGLDYTGLFTDNDLFNVVINMRSGDSYVASNCILAEIPNHSALNGTSEISFKTMDIKFDQA